MWRMDLLYGLRFSLWCVGVNSGVLPTKGLTLPLVSMAVDVDKLSFNCLILRIDYENRMRLLGLRDG